MWDHCRWNHQSNLTSGVLSLHLCVCLTHDHSTEESVIGYCPYSLVMNSHEPFHVFPVTNTSFNDSCTVWKREGPLCSTCKPDYGIPMHTYYDLKCVKCPHSQFRKILRFLAVSVSLLPPTIFVHLLVLHPPWNIFAFVTQLCSAPLGMKTALNTTQMFSPYQVLITEITATIFSPWNLDFFKAVYTPECISPGITPNIAAVVDYYY